MQLEFNGTASAPDWDEMNRIEDELIQAVNIAYKQFGCVSQVYARAVRNLNDFAMRKPLKSGEKHFVYKVPVA